MSYELAALIQAAAVLISNSLANMFPTRRLFLCGTPYIHRRRAPTRKTGWRQPQDLLMYSNCRRRLIRCFCERKFENKSIECQLAVRPFVEVRPIIDLDHIGFTFSIK